MKGEKMLVLIETLLYVVNTLVKIYMLIILLRVVIDFLVNYDILSLNNQKLKNATKTLYILTEPVFSWFRKKLPPINGIDFSAWIALFCFYVVSVLLDKLS